MSSNGDLFRQLDLLSDSEIAAISMGSDKLTLSTPLVVNCRYIRDIKLAPGLPFGLQNNPDGSATLGHVAIVRVIHKDAVAQTKALAMKSAVYAVVIGVVTGLLTVASSIAITNRSSADIHQAAPIAPCQVVSISTQEVTCYINGKLVGVPVGTWFPGRQFRLLQASPTSESFSTIYERNKHAYVFQLGRSATTKESK